MLPVIDKNIKDCFNQSNHSTNVQNQDMLPVIDKNISRSTDLISCISCKGLKGLKADHRSCKTIKSFDKEIVNDLNSQDINDDHIDIDSDVCRETPSLKTGIKIPSLKTGIKIRTNDKKWEMASEYFKANIKCGGVSSADDINNCRENFNEILDDYFAEKHQKVDNITNNKKELIKKYKDFSKQQLKSELNKQKKDRNATLELARYISKLLCF